MPASNPRSSAAGDRARGKGVRTHIHSLGYTSLELKLPVEGGFATGDSENWGLGGNLVFFNASSEEDHPHFRSIHSTHALRKAGTQA